MEAPKKSVRVLRRVVVMFVLTSLMLLPSACGSRRSVPRPREENRTEIRNSDASTRGRIAREARRWLGTPYRYGGDERGRGTDCSGMVCRVYHTVTGIKLPRNSAAQREFCRQIRRQQLTTGDLVFFTSSSRSSRITHVGIYLEGGRFIHASSSRGVIVSSLDERYYQTHFHSAARVPGLTAPQRKTSSETSPEVRPAPEPVVEIRNLDALQDTLDALADSIFNSVRNAF